MKRPCSIVASALSAAALAATSTARAAPPGADPAPGPPDRRELSERLRAEVDRFAAAGTFEGAVLVSLGGRVVLEHAVGHADRSRGARSAPGTVFAVGSLSKQFTAAAVLALAADGRLTLDDPLSRHLPGYPAERLARDGAEVTLDHLLHHTSGLPDIDLEVEVVRARWRRPLSVDDQVAIARARPLRSRPGTAFRYSNLGYDLLGEVVRRVSGQGLDAYLRERLLAPLGMEHTSYADPPGGPEVQARGSFRVLGRRFDAAGGFGLGALPLDETHASGGLRTTTHDLLRWTALYDGQGPLPAPWAAVMTRPGLESYGAGVVAIDSDGWRGVWHNGALSPLGYASELAYYPEQRAAVIVLGNVDVAEGGAPARLRANLVRLLQGREPARPAEASRLSALLSAPRGLFLYASLGPWRYLFFAALVAQQAYLIARPRSSRFEALATAVNAWPLLILLFTLADLPAPVRWSGWLGAALLVGLAASRVAPLPWHHREPRRQLGTLAVALVSPAIAAWMLGRHLLTPALLAALALLGGLLWSRVRPPAPSVRGPAPEPSVAS